MYCPNTNLYLVIDDSTHEIRYLTSEAGKDYNDKIETVFGQVYRILLIVERNVSCDTEFWTRVNELNEKAGQWRPFTHNPQGELNV